MKKIVEQYKSIPITVKASIWYTICSIIQKSIAFLTVPVFTRMLTEGEFGQFNIYQSWLNILMIVVTLSLYGGVFNNAMMKYEKDRDGFISSMQGLVFCLCFAWFLLYLISPTFWNNVLDLTTPLVIVMFFELLAQPAMNFWAGKRRYEYKYKSFVFVTLILTIINPIVGIVAVSLAENKGYARILSNALVIIIICGIIFIYNLIKGKKFFVIEYWKYALMFNIPLVPYYISQMLFTQSDRIMIGKMVGQDKAGIYSLAMNCSTVVAFVLTAIESSFIPWLYKNMKTGKYKEIGKIGNELLVFVGIALIGLTLIGPELVMIMGPEEYQEAIWVIPPIVGGQLFLFESKLFVGIEFYYEHKRGLVIASIVSAVTNVCLNWLLIPRVGYIIAGFTTLIAYILFAMINYFYMQRIVHKNIKFLKNIYDFKFILSFSLIYLLISFGIMMLYSAFWIRYMITIIVLFFLLINNKRIKQKIIELRGK